MIVRALVYSCSLKLSDSAREALAVALGQLRECGIAPTAEAVVGWCDHRMTGGRMELPAMERREQVAELRDAIIAAALELVEVRP